MYNTEEPSSNDSIVIKPITIVRTGDLSRKSIVRISTSDETAKAGKDYKAKTETITFEPGVSALDFDINILFDTDDENLENFKVYLGPQDPIAAIFGKIISSSVVIKDNSENKEQNLLMSKYDPLTLISDNTERLPSSPYLMSLREFSLDNILKDDQKITMASSAYPLICVHVSHFKNKCFTKLFQTNSSRVSKIFLTRWLR